jgi:predicted dehydrogenase
MSEHARLERDPDRRGDTGRHTPGSRRSAQPTPPRSTIRLGVIGYMGPENAHPYSWSAIVNGTYNADVMPLYANKRILAYLEANRDSLGIDGARVTHVWTQDRVISERIVAASRVPHIAHEPRAMVDAVDAVLIARDDPESHAALAQPFLEAGMPVLIDKPLASTESDLAFFVDHDRAGRLVMSSSSMRYATEVRVLKESAATLGPVRLVAAVGVKDWVSYGVHVLEAICTVLDDPRALRVRHGAFGYGEVVEIEFDGGTIATIHQLRNTASTMQLHLYGEGGSRSAELDGLFAAHRGLLQQFIRSVAEGKSRLPFEVTRNVISILLAGLRSKDRQGAWVEPA